MSNNATQALVGAVVLAIALAFVVYAGRVSGFGDGDGSAPVYFASFRSVEGVSVGDPLADRNSGPRADSQCGVSVHQARLRVYSRARTTASVAGRAHHGFHSR